MRRRFVYGCRLMRQQHESLVRVPACQRFWQIMSLARKSSAAPVIYAGKVEAAPLRAGNDRYAFISQDAQTEAGNMGAPWFDTMIIFVIAGNEINTKRRG